MCTLYKDGGGATTEGGGRGPPLFHSGLLCRTRPLECGFLRVFVSEARNSVCPLRLLEPGHGSSRRTLPIEQSGPLAGTRGVISQLACCTTTRLPSHTSARSRSLPRLLRAYTNVHHVIRFFICRLSRLPRESRNYKQAHSRTSVLTTRRYALEERGRVIGWRSSGSRSSWDPHTRWNATRFPSARHVLQSWDAWLKNRVEGHGFQ